jgi:uncharacterized protein YoxC
VTGLAQTIIVVCVVILTAVLVATLVSVRRTIQRTDTVLELVEREIRPMASQLQALAEDLRGLTRQVTQEVERVSVVVRRVEDLSLRAAKLAGVVASFGKVGQFATMAVGVKRALDVFISRLKSRG